MLIDNAAPVVEDKLVLGPGEPWEIFFFAANVVEGARKGHFNAAHGSMHYVLRKLGFACVGAMLARRIGWRRGAYSRFVVVRKAGMPCAAMLLKDQKGKDGKRVLTIHYLVVASSARREGIGKMLVDYAKRRGADGGVDCYCTEASRGMQRLLKRQGFVRTHRAKELVINDDERLSVPSRWVWQP